MLEGITNMGRIWQIHDCGYDKYVLVEKQVHGGYGKYMIVVIANTCWLRNKYMVDMANT